MNNNVAPDEKLDINIRDISDTSGQVAIGKYNSQFRIENPSAEALIELIKYLDERRKFNDDILKNYSPSALPRYPAELSTFVTENRVDEITQGLVYLENHDILLISGVGGVGKTTLAQALVETRPANVPLPFWFDHKSHSSSTLGDILEKLAEYLQAPVIASFKEEKREAKQHDIDRLIGIMQMKEYVWLIFDNLETILEKDRHFHDPDINRLFTSLRNTSHNAKIIVTSRMMPILANGDHLIDSIEDEKKELKGLTINFAIDYLIKNGLDSLEQEKLKKLAEGVDGHPLALRLLVELVKEYGVQDIMNDLGIYKKSRENTIRIARRLFEKLAGDEKELLEYLSVFRQPAPRNALKKMFTERTSLDAIEKLTSKSLLETDHEGSYWLHSLVREFAYDDLENKKEVHEIAMQYYLSILLPEERTSGTVP